MSMDTRHFPAEKRVSVQWQHAGMNFIENVVQVGGVIPLHKHAYGHHACVWCDEGEFLVMMTSPEGMLHEQRMRAGMVYIDKGWQHSFVYLGMTGIGKVLCLWPVGADGAGQ